MIAGARVWALALAIAGVGMLVAVLGVVSALYLNTRLSRALVFYVTAGIGIALLAALVVGAYATFGVASGLAVQFGALAVLIPALWLLVRRLASRAVPSEVRVPNWISG